MTDEVNMLVKRLTSDSLTLSAGFRGDTLKILEQEAVVRIYANCVQESFGRSARRCYQLCGLGCGLAHRGGRRTILCFAATLPTAYFLGWMGDDSVAGILAYSGIFLAIYVCIWIFMSHVKRMNERLGDMRAPK